MKKLLFGLLFCFTAAASSLFAQTTLVTGTVTDVNSIPYAGARMTAGLVFPPGVPTNNPTVTISVLATCRANGFGSAPCQVPFQPSNGPFSLDGSGNIPGGGITLQDNTLVTPAGTTWAFTVNSAGNPPPLGTGPQTCAATLTITGSSQSITGSFSACPALGRGGAVSPTTVNPVIQSGLLADYQMQTVDSACSLKDYSPTGNNATGCVGTSPTIIPVTGGLNFTGNGAISLPVSLNSSLTLQFFIAFQGTTAANVEALVDSTAACCAASTQFALNTWNGSTLGQPPLSNALGGQFHITANCSSQTINAQDFWNGTGTIALTMAAGGHLYLNGSEVQDYGQGVPLTCAGIQTSGNWQLGGTSINTSFYSGQIYRALFYNRALSATEIQFNHNALAVQMAARGVSAVMGVAPSFSNTAGKNQILFLGDSITRGVAATALWTSNIQSNAPNISTAFVSNNSLTGQTAQALLNSQATDRDTIYDPAAQSNTAVLWAGTNDVVIGGVPSQTAYAINTAACAGARKFGWRTGLISMIDRTGNSAKKNSLNALLRVWAPYCDFFIDMGGTTQLGADGANANVTWFAGDATHPNNNGIFNVISPLVGMVVNRYLYGHHDFTTATVYSSPAPAAVATTSGTQVGNNVVLNFAGGNTCLNGILCTCTGITPAAYNQTYYSFGGSTATQLAAGFNLTSGLGAITVQGSCSSPQQQDVDQYVILNFGAGNFTLQTCQAYTGQRIYIKNTNAVASTVVAFPAQAGSNTPWSAETIDGAASISVAQNVVAILESQLVSPAAGGCTWKRIQ